MMFNAVKKLVMNEIADWKTECIRLRYCALKGHVISSETIQKVKQSYIDMIFEDKCTRCGRYVSIYQDDNPEYYIIDEDGMYLYTKTIILNII